MSSRNSNRPSLEAAVDSSLEGCGAAQACGAVDGPWICGLGVHSFLIIKFKNEGDIIIIVVLHYYYYYSVVKIKIIDYAYFC